MEARKLKLLKQWYIKANNDLKSIENEFSCEEPITDVICFHSQQAVEKLFKLYILFQKEKLLKTHNIAILLKECISLNPKFKILKGIEYLTDYAVELRYPDNFYIPDLEEAQEAYADANRVKNFIDNLAIFRTNIENK